MRDTENVTKAYQNKNESPHTQDIFLSVRSHTKGVTDEYTFSSSLYHS